MKEHTELGEERFNHVAISDGNPDLLLHLDGLVDLLQGKNTKIALKLMEASGSNDLQD